MIHQSNVEFYRNNKSYEDFILNNKVSIEEWESLMDKKFTLAQYKRYFKKWKDEIITKYTNEGHVELPHDLGHLYLVSYSKVKSKKWVNEPTGVRIEPKLNYHFDKLAFKPYLRSYSSSIFLTSFFGKIELDKPVREKIEKYLRSGNYSIYPQVINNKEIQFLGKKKGTGRSIT